MAISTVLSSQNPWPAEPPAGDEPVGRTTGRLARLFMGARILVAACLLVLHGALLALQSGSTPLQGTALFLDLILAAYLAETVLSAWVVERMTARRAGQVSTARFLGHWSLQFWSPADNLRLTGFWGLTTGVDLGVFSLLQWTGPDGSSYLLLFMLPVLMAGSLGARAMAHAVAGVATLVVLTRAWLRFAGFDASGADTVLVQPALACVGFFAVAELTYQLATRMRREEERAQIGFSSARQQALLNQMIIDELDRGVAVVDASGRVKLANPAALRLLSWSGESSRELADEPRYRALAEAVTALFADGDHAALHAEGGMIAIGSAQAMRRLQVRARVFEAGEDGERLALLFLEDQRDLERRMQQEKLAAMGRMSASIAHEIRNPLAAIVSANALLIEDTPDAPSRQLLDMVATNAQRLTRIVHDVLDVAHMQLPEHVKGIDLAPAVVAIVSDWEAAAGEHGRLALAMPPKDTKLAIRFDLEHLRRVLTNLLDNAARHASQRPDAIRLICERTEGEDGDGVRLSVQSDGPPLPDAISTSLFEPFFSTQARGTGLGLYICRELCARYGALLDYRRISGEPGQKRGYNDFRITAPLLKASDGKTAVGEDICGRT